MGFNNHIIQCEEKDKAIKMDSAGIFHCRKRRSFHVYSRYTQSGSTDKPAASIAGQRLQHTILE